MDGNVGTRLLIVSNSAADIICCGAQRPGWRESPAPAASGGGSVQRTCQSVTRPPGAAVASSRDFRPSSCCRIVGGRCATAMASPRGALKHDPAIGPARGRWARAGLLRISRPHTLRAEAAARAPRSGIGRAAGRSCRDPIEFGSDAQGLVSAGSGARRRSPAPWRQVQSARGRRADAVLARRWVHDAGDRLSGSRRKHRRSNHVRSTGISRRAIGARVAARATAGRTRGSAWDIDGRLSGADRTADRG